MSKVTLHMVSSLDGFIAKKNGDVSWLQSTDNYEKGITLTEEDITAFVKAIDCYIMGSKTYEHALELGWPYGDKPVIVLTNRNLSSNRESVTFYSGDLTKLIHDQLRPSYKNIWMVGGTKTTKDFIRLKLVDDIIISIMPILLGDGILFFDYIKQEQKLHLKDVTTYKDGMVELWYEIKK
ncbi:dihydrofolate reductase family protein [Aquimarina sp. 2201CG5-10]|uniref:dihydrofolate reductase family protein n=1 Tax=Aquimarina callyspongiae TaxID=3098150 RepID=UPI002AB49343|nr:dihydrofolate reductase family protein [Aquimarina sp. 2201CG5-10]MDY8135372.1 dihydrofolate reductase family protein [Aquimarina sp. 2201CG5-10]